MGRNPKVNLKQEVYHATKEHQDALEKSTPVFEKQDFIPPLTLTPKELDVWNWLVGIFRNMTNCMVSDADIQLMELYCRAKVATDEADAAIKKDPRYYIIVPLGQDKEGGIKTTAKANPNYKIKTDNAMLCLKFFDQLGLSPLARARAGVKGAKSMEEESKWKSILERNDD